MKKLTALSGEKRIGEVLVADSFLRRFFGLMGKTPIEQGLLLDPCGDIHTFFMREAIDVVFLDGKGRALRVIPSMPPWKMSGIVRGAKRVLELPSGTLDALGLNALESVVFTEARE